ncbi:beta-1,3-galactosyltransferase 1-like [Antedon mediterranea]|uniref:beta-1,3-galactosyltransferase 1-like n=1 Tax=Antedon mediterranea TaxID=105859 RepID=UPI003AF4A964
MKRKLLRNLKFIILLIILTICITFVKRLQEPKTERRNFYRRNGKIDTLTFGTWQPESVSVATGAHRIQQDNVEDVDRMLKQWKPHFDRFEEIENRQNGVDLTNKKENEVHENEDPIFIIKAGQVKYNQTAEDAAERIERLLKETAKGLKEDSIVKIRSNEPGVARDVYVIRRKDNKIKITKTKPMYTSHEVNDFNISYIIPNKYACDGDRKVFILTMIFNQHTEERYRRIVRQYWGKANVVKNKRIQHIFLLGKTENKVLQRRTQRESEKFGDIVQGNFLDTYKNLTLKTLLGFQWVRDFCPEATFVLKVDSDIIVNYLSLVPHLVASPTTGFVEGHVQSSLQPSRKKYSKWFISEEDYPEATFAPYVVGPSYLMSTDVTTKVLYTSPFVRFLPWEDAYVGLILKKLNITNVHSKGYIVKLQGENIWHKICEIQKYFTFYVGRELDENRVKFIVDGWHQEINFCKGK